MAAPTRTRATGLRVRPTREGESKAGTPIYGKIGWLKAPLYVGASAEELAAAGVDLDKPIEVIIVNVGSSAPVRVTVPVRRWSKIHGEYPASRPSDRRRWDRWTRM